MRLRGKVALLTGAAAAKHRERRQPLPGAALNASGDVRESG